MGEGKSNHLFAAKQGPTARAEWIWPVPGGERNRLPPSVAVWSGDSGKTVRSIGFRASTGRVHIGTAIHSS